MPILNLPSRFARQYRVAVYLILAAIMLTLIIYIFPFNRNMGNSDKIKRIYFADNISVAHQKIIDQFNTRYSGQIEVIPIDLPFTVFNTNERKELIARALRGKNSRIDIFAVDLIWLPRFAKWAEPLGAYIPESDLNKLLPQALSTCYFEDQLVGIPLYIDVGILYYRRDLLENLPNYNQIRTMLEKSITWEQMLKIYNDHFVNKPFYMFQGASYEGLICNYIEILGGNNGQLYSGNKFQLTSPEALQSCQFMVDLIYKYQVTPPIATSFTENESYLYALSNDIPFIRGWPSFTSNISVFPEDSAKVNNLVIAQLPHFQGKNPATVFGGWNLMIAKDSAEKEAASLFLQYVYSEDAQKILYEYGGYLPIRTDIYEDEVYCRENSSLLQLKSIMDSGIHRPALINYTRISDILSQTINKTLTGKQTVPEAMGLALELINGL